MSNLFIAIVSCHNNKKKQQAIRDTWLTNCPVPYSFFIGQPLDAESVGDVHSLDVPDNDLYLCRKVHAMWQYISAKYDYVFKVDDDCYVVMDRLLNPDRYLNHDYIGWYKAFPSANSHYIHGSSIWFSRKAIEIIASSNELLRDDRAEDVFTAKALEGHVLFEHDYRYPPYAGPFPSSYPIQDGWTVDGPIWRQIKDQFVPGTESTFWEVAPENDLVSAHHLTPEDMYRIHKKFIQTVEQTGTMGRDI